jgi:transcriptional regulator with XRE-family HTH domain
MLQITADVFSGRPNPTWIVADDEEIRATLRDAVKVLSLATKQAAGLGQLGELRGFYLDIANDELAADYGVASALYLPLEAGGTGPMRDLAERLISLASAENIAMGALAEDIDESQIISPNVLRSFLNQKLGKETGISAPDSNAAAEAEAACEASAEAEAAVTCYIEFSAYNPGFWNNDPNIRSRNNCYNYASNKRTDTFAQPGRGSGHMYTAITCPAVSQAALYDGLHRRYVCFPDSEKPRYLVALVVAPGPGFVDFHWYRKNKEGFWSHKPGGTAARNVDNSGRVIYDPATCDRGPYTQFCGYFYTCRSQRIR